MLCTLAILVTCIWGVTNVADRYTRNERNQVSETKKLNVDVDGTPAEGSPANTASPGRPMTASVLSGRLALVDDLEVGSSVPSVQVARADGGGSVNLARPARTTVLIFGSYT